VALLEVPGCHVRTDADGCYSFRDIAPGSYTIRVFKGGYVARDIIGVTIDPGTCPRRDVSLPLRGEMASGKPTAIKPVQVNQVDEMKVVKVTAEILRGTEVSLLPFPLQASLTKVPAPNPNNTLARDSGQQPLINE